MACATDRGSRPCPSHRGSAKRLWLLSLAGAVLLSACGGGSSSRVSQIPTTFSGNWQFTMAAPADGSFLGGLQGGFLLQGTGSVKGNADYSIALPPAQNPSVCNTGSAPITGTISGQGVVLTAVAGTQTFTLTGTLSFDGRTMAGTYTATAGTASDGSPCGEAQPLGLQWSALLVQPLTGSLQGNFHSTGGSAGLNEQSFLVSGSLTQANNTGASSAAVTGNLSFMNAVLDESDYPCIANASVSGQISGNTVILQLTGSDGSSIGQIGASPASGLQTATLDQTQNGYFLHSLGAPAYAVYAAACGGGTLAAPADSGEICLGLNSPSACAQPITLTPAALIFPAQTQGTASMQTITLANTSRAIVSNLTLTLTNPDNFAETDECGLEGLPAQGQPFNLNPAQSCVITITFTPQCGTQCSSPINAALTVTSPVNDTIYTLPITGTGIASGAALTRAFDFGAGIISEATARRAGRSPSAAGSGRTAPVLTASGT